MNRRSFLGLAGAAPLVAPIIVTRSLAEPTHLPAIHSGGASLDVVSKVEMDLAQLKYEFSGKVIDTMRRAKAKNIRF